MTTEYRIDRARVEANDPEIVARYVQLAHGPEPDIDQIVTVARRTAADPPPLAVAISPEDAQGVEFPPPGFGVPTYHVNPLVERGKAWLTHDPLLAKLFDHATLLKMMGSMAGDFARTMNRLGEDKRGEQGGDGGGGAGDGAEPARPGHGGATGGTDDPEDERAAPHGDAGADPPDRD